MSWYKEDINTSRGNCEKREERTVETVRNEDLPTEEVVPKREEIPTLPSSKESRSCEESGETVRTEFQSKRNKCYHEQSPDTPTIEKFKGRPRGARASFGENKIETVGDVREVTSSALRLQEIEEEIGRSRKQWSASADFNTGVGDTEEETPTIEAVKCRPRGARASFWENKISNMATETVDQRVRENAHRQKMEEEILRFRKPWRKIMRAVGITEKVAETSDQQSPEEPSDSSDEEKALSDSASSDEEYYARIQEHKRQAKLKKAMNDNKMDKTIATEVENVNSLEFPKKPNENVQSYQEQARSESSSDEEYYARIDEMKRQAKLIKEISDDEMDYTVAMDLENLDIHDFPKKPNDSKQSYQEQARSESSSDEEYYARIDEMKRQAKLIKEISDDEMDYTVAMDLENLDIRDFPKKPNDSKNTNQFDVAKRNNSQSRAAAVTEKKFASERYADIDALKTPVEFPQATEKKSAPGQSAEKSADQDCYTQADEAIEVYYDALSPVEENRLAVLAETQHQVTFQNEEVNKVSRWKRILKKVGLVAILTSCSVGGLYLLYTQADDETIKRVWNTASKILPFVEPIPEPEPEKSFLWKILDYFMPPPPPPEPERSFLWELLDNLPSFR